MKAVVFTRYGTPDVLELKEIPAPVPNNDEVLVRIHAVSVNDWDFALYGDLINRMIFGLIKPKKQILGSDIAGVVEAAGKNITRFKPGDEVFGDLSGRWGGFAEYVCAPEKMLARKSPRMTFEQAAAIPQAGMLAVQGLRDIGGLRAGQKVLINGAGGGVGTFAIQLAKLEEGVEVTAVDRGEKLDLMRSLGADHVVDYTAEDVTRRGERFDLILDVKTTRSILDWSRILNRGGTWVTLGGSMPRALQALALAPFLRGKSIRMVMLKTNSDLDLMTGLFDAGKVVPVMDGRWSLEDVPAALRYLRSGRHKGKLVITVRSARPA